MTKQASTLGDLLNPQFGQDRLIAAGMSHAEAIAKGQRFATAARVLVDTGRRADAPAVAVFVPGRIEVLGKHTDYCGGRSLLCTVERGMCFVAAAKTNPTIRFNAIDLNDQATLALDRELEPVLRHWSNYPMTVARRIARNFPEAKIGADIAMSSDLPAASGLSSSSAMIIGCFLALAGVNQLKNSSIYQKNIRHQEDLAAYLGCTENGQSFRGLAGDRGVGTFGGSQDHTAILCCKPGMLSQYSFCPVAHERDIALPEDVKFLIAHSGVEAEKTGDALEKYNLISQRARQIVSIWNDSTGKHAACLREAIQSSPTALAELRRSLQHDADPFVIERLEQFIVESEQIIPKAGDAFRSRDWNALQVLVNESQSRAEHQLHNQVPQTVGLQKKLLESGAIAASAFGAGFGGSVWGLYRGLSDADQDRMLADLPGAFFTRAGCAAAQITDLES